MRDRSTGYLNSFGAACCFNSPKQIQRLEVVVGKDIAHLVADSETAEEVGNLRSLAVADGM